MEIYYNKAKDFLSFVKMENEQRHRLSVSVHHLDLDGNQTTKTLNELKQELEGHTLSQDSISYALSMVFADQS